MEFTFRPCVLEDALILRDFSIKTFSETFSHLNTPETMKAYLDESFNINKIRGELLNVNSHFYFLCSDGKLAGYLKLNNYPAQTDINDQQSLEIERIYVAKEFQGEGFGRLLMEKAIDIAKMQKKSYLWLGVWEKNEKAIGFYEKSGFSAVGTHSFIMGEEEQTDFVMRRNL